jgi:hypothetical protein
MILRIPKRSGCSHIRKAVLFTLLGLVLVSACSPQVASELPATETQVLLPSNTATPVFTVTITPLPSLTPVRTPPPSSELYVDANDVQGKISPLVYGTNYGPWLFVPLQMQDIAKDAHLTILRYPGGNWGDLNEMDEWNIDQFVAFCRQIGADINIHVRLKNGSAERAAEIVQYVNIEKQYNVKYWTIGNEPNLFKEGYEISQFNQDWREWALAMRAVDPTIQFIGPEVNQYFADPQNDYEQTLEDWIVEFLKANGDMVDVLSVHKYPFPESVNSGPPTTEELRASAREWDGLVPALHTLAREYAGRDLPVAFTEVNSSWAASSSGEATLDSHVNGIWWGAVLGKLIRDDAFIVNQFAIIGDFGLMNKYDVYPIYNVYLMYQKFGTERLFAASDDPDVSIFAAKRPDGALTIMLVNLTGSTVTKKLTIEHFGEYSISETWLFDQEHTVELVPNPTNLNADSFTMSTDSMMLFVLNQ